MSDPVNLFGEDIATNAQLSSLFNELLEQQSEFNSRWTQRVEALPDFDDPTAVLVGIAPQGTAETTPNWTVLFIQISETTLSKTVAKNIAWTERANGSYS